MPKLQHEGIFLRSVNREQQGKEGFRVSSRSPMLRLNEQGREEAAFLARQRQDRGCPGENCMLEGLHWGEQHEKKQP
jgi:hypothetical protein